MTRAPSHSALLLFGAVCAAGTGTACTPRSTASVSPASADIPVFPVEKFTLPNGLRVVMSVDRSAPVVALDVFYHVGSKNEVVGRTGFAHLFEHVMFEGSQNVPSGRHRQMLVEGGGAGSAFTVVDYTEYYNVFPNNYLETVLWLESDRMGFLVPTLTEDKLKLQRDVVNNERKQNYLNVPFGVEPIIAMPNLYPAGHPYSWRTIGYEEDLTKATVDDVRAFFTRYYVPNNALISIVGDIDVAETKALIQKYFGDIPRGADVERARAAPITLPAEKRVVLEDAKGQLPKITFIWPTVGVHDPDEVRLQALSQLLTGDQGNTSSARTSRLTRLMIYDRELATSVEATQVGDELAGMFLLEISPRPGVTLTQIEGVVDSVMPTIASAPPSDVEIARLRNYLLVDRITNLQSALRKSEAIGLSELYFSDPHRYAKDARAIMSVEPSDIQRVAKRFFGSGRLVISMVPAGKLDLISRPDKPYVNVTPGVAAPAAR